MERDAERFPYTAIRSNFGCKLAAKLEELEQEDHLEPHATFATVINTTLVWMGARTATLPSWSHCSKPRIVEFINVLNECSQEIDHSLGQPDELYILHRQQICHSGEEVVQSLITRRNCPRIHSATNIPIDDGVIGLELDMYLPNVRFFVSSDPRNPPAFSVWEAGSDVLLFVEVWSEATLSPHQLEEFRDFCERRLCLWNSAMEKLGLRYRFYGTMDWKVSEIPLCEAVETMRFSGKQFMGVNKRAPELCAECQRYQYRKDL
jgi:hypothetical protein